MSKYCHIALEFRFQNRRFGVALPIDALAAGGRPQCDRLTDC
jgi:hypothetical protein